MFSFIASGIKTIKNFASETKNKFSKIFDDIFGKDNADVREQVFRIMLEADFGYEISLNIARNISEKVKKGKIENNSLEIRKCITEEISAFLKEDDFDNVFIGGKLPVIFLVGINGAGKTSFCGKLAHYVNKNKDRKILIVGADTFRCAAKEQAFIWANRAGATFFINGNKDSPSTEVYKGIDHAIKNNYNFVIVDVAGRMENNAPLMDELKKTVSMCDKFDVNKHVMLVVDACLGSTTIKQAKFFHDSVQANSLIATKIDSSSKGGCIVGAANSCNIGISFLSIGEKIEDLQKFNRKDFVEKMFGVH